MSERELEDGAPMDDVAARQNVRSVDWAAPSDGAPREPRELGVSIMQLLGIAYGLLAVVAVFTTVSQGGVDAVDVAVGLGLILASLAHVITARGIRNREPYARRVSFGLILAGVATAFYLGSDLSDVIHENVGAGIPLLMVAAYAALATCLYFDGGRKATT